MAPKPYHGDGSAIHFDEKQMQVLRSLRGVHEVPALLGSGKLLEYNGYTDEESWFEISRMLVDEYSREIVMPGTLKRGDYKTVVGVKFSHEFDEEEIGNSHLFHCIPKKCLAEADYDKSEAGRLVVENDSIDGRLSIGAVGAVSGRVFVGFEKLRTSMVEAGFHGLHFTEPEIQKGRKSPKKIWEIGTDNLMPPLQVDYFLGDARNSKRSIGNYSPEGWCEIADIWPGLLRFKSEELDLLPSADVYRTREILGGVLEGEFPPHTNVRKGSHYVVSKRFRDWALKQRLPLEFIPVIAL